VDADRLGDAGMNYYRVGDVRPNLQILIRDSGMIIDVTNINVYVRWQRADQTEIAERLAAKVDASNGVCAYEWEEGDLTVPGAYHAIIQLSPVGSPTIRQSLETPPQMHVEVLPNDFDERDATLDAVMPVPTSYEVALAMGNAGSQIDGDVMMTAINRARRLAYIQCHIFLLVGADLTPLQTNMLRDLTAQLAALLIVQQPSVVYGPFQKESIGSYDYELKKIDTEVDLYGVTSIDAIIKYFREHVQSVMAPGLWVEYPEWWQPITERLSDPSRWGTLPL